MTEGKERGDWVDNYNACEHILALPVPAPTEGIRHRGFSVCCEACYPDFLYREA